MRFTCLGNFYLYQRPPEPRGLGSSAGSPHTHRFAAHRYWRCSPGTACPAPAAAAGRCSWRRVPCCSSRGLCRAGWWAGRGVRTSARRPCSCPAEPQSGFVQPSRPAGEMRRLCLTSQTAPESACHWLPIFIRHCVAGKNTGEIKGGSFLAGIL